MAKSGQIEIDRWWSYHITHLHDTSNCFTYKKKQKRRGQADEGALRKNDDYPRTQLDDGARIEEDCKLIELVKKSAY